MKRISIISGSLKLFAELNDSKTATAIYESLPLELNASTWGEEVYLKTSLELDEENPAPNVPPGTVAFWPPEGCLCFFYGQKPASPVNVIGELLCNPRELAAIKAGDKVAVAVSNEEPESEKSQPEHSASDAPTPEVAEGE